jgi:hypothetical protein
MPDGLSPRDFRTDPTTPQEEVVAIGEMVDTLLTLDPAARVRVLEYLHLRFPHPSLADYISPVYPGLPPLIGTGEPHAKRPT